MPSLGAALGASSNSKAVKKAAAAQQAAIAAAQQGFQKTYGEAQAAYNPYITAGTNALGQQSNLLGLNGNEAQAGGISALEASPLFQSLNRNGQEAILQNASATGGLRGGNTQRGLADFSADTLASVIQQQLGNLGGISSQGLNATGNLAGLGADNARSMAGLFGASGDVSASSILGRQAIQNDLQKQITQQIQGAATAGAGGGAGGIGGSLSGIFGQLFSGGGGTGSAIQINPAALVNASGGSIFKPGGF
jgi:hypothetical protein